ncbi:MAG: OmpH family outer membrane protein [Deltaproteobacteria bacterium]
MNVSSAMTKRLLILAAMVVAVSFPGFARADEAGLGSIDLRKVYQSSVRIKAAVESIQKLEVDSKANLERIISEVKALEAKLKEGKQTQKKEEKEKLEAKLKAKQDQLKEERQALRVKLAFKHKSVETEIRVKVKEAIDKAAQEANLKGVISDTVLLYSKGMPDITDNVLKFLDAGLAKKSQKKPAPAKKAK